MLQALMALLMADAVAPGENVAQTVVRFGMPPGTPVKVQSARRFDGTGSADAGGTKTRAENAIVKIVLIMFELIAKLVLATFSQKEIKTRWQKS